MSSNLRTILVSLALAAILSAPVASAFDINDLLRSDQPGFETGLDGYYAGECQLKGEEFLKLFKEGYLKQLVTEGLKSYAEDLRNYAVQIAVAKLASILGFGSGVPGGFVANRDVGGTIADILKRKFMDEVESRFIASCTANKMRVEIGNDIRRIIQENGPDGAPAYVTDWVEDVYVSEDQRAILRFCAQLANTDVCPYMANDVAAYFGKNYSCPLSYFQNPPSLVGLNAGVDGGEPFLSRAACTMPDGFDPELLSADFVGYGGFDALNRYLRPENNFENFVAMAEAELASQRATLVRAAEAEAIGAGGYRSAYGPCLNFDENGKCLAFGPIRQPAGALRDANAAVVQGEIDWVVNSKDSPDELVGDVRLRVVSMMMDMAAQALDYDVEIGRDTQKYVDIGSGDRAPEEVTAPTPTPGPDDLACTGGDSRCRCVRDDPNLEPLRMAVGDATRQATIQHPELVTPTGCVGNECTVVAGQNVTFLNAVCDTTLGDSSLHCHPKAGSSDQIVVDFGFQTISVDILASDGQVLVPGQPIAMCDIGVQ